MTTSDHQVAADDERQDRMEQLRHEVLADTFLHLAHHRGQLTVYLRMNEAKVPSVYGPSADDQRFL
ncbi:MAG: hypothetical protein U0Q11_22480 [Vicinamibacterales bacterium]